MTPLEASLLRDALRASLVTRDQWCALVIRWLDDVEMATPWMLAMLDAQEPRCAIAALEQGYPEIPDISRDEDAGDHGPWPLLGFLYLRHERGLPLWNTLTEAIEWCEERACWRDLNRLGQLRSDYEYDQSVHEDMLGGAATAEMEAQTERGAREVFARHRAVALPWWEETR